ncbi:hypothetical protein WA026_016077 [Henosepilachna vigintioctopunctata]|uniref:MADF domain-containing protein n=1 Tax=Henosepilachna vigintioctopunctata TaxID=420089 RepID=A0AAW1U7N7_9CUCU
MASTSQTASHFQTDPENSEREFISLLIDLYRDCPELWKVKSKDYCNRNKRSAAFEKIVGTLRKLKPDFSVKQLKQKINVLLIYIKLNPVDNRNFLGPFSKSSCSPLIPNHTGNLGGVHEFQFMSG